MGDWFDVGLNELFRNAQLGWRLYNRVFGWLVGGTRLGSHRRAKYAPPTLELAAPGPRRWRRVLRFLTPIWVQIFLIILGASLAIVFGLLFLTAREPSLTAIGWFLGGVVMFIGGIGLRRVRDNLGYFKRRSVPLNLAAATAYNIQLPRATDWHSTNTYMFLTHLLVTFERFALRIYADSKDVHWQILDLRQAASPQAMIQAVRTFYPDASVTVYRLVPAPVREPFYRSIIPCTLEAIFPAPLVQVDELKDYDPLHRLVQATSHLRPGERITYTLYLAGPAYGASQIGQQMITHTDISAWHYTDLGTALALEHMRAAGQDRSPEYVAYLQREMYRKLARPLYHAVLLMQFDAESEQRVNQMRQLAGLVDGYAKSQLNSLIPAESREFVMRRVAEDDEAIRTDTLALLGSWLTNRDRKWKKFLMVLEPGEVAALWHLPYQSFPTDRITWLTSKQVPPSRDVLHNRAGICLGVSPSADRQDPIYLPMENRDTHIQIIGKTKTGKSTLMHRIIQQDILHNRGVCVIDPHGTLVRNILRTFVPPSREQDVVVLDLANDRYPIPLNPLAGRRWGRPEIGRIVGVLTRLYGDWEHAPRMANALTSALVTLQADPHPTPRDVVKLFLNDDYRAELLSQVTDELTLEFWYEEYENFSQAQRDQIRDPVIYRMRALYANPDLYPILCHPDGLNFTEFIRQRKIVLLSLGVDERRIPAREQNLLGSLLISQLQMEAMSTPRSAEPFYVYIDEVQNFVTTSLRDLFSEARKFGLSLTVANQYLAQLAGPTLDAIVGNVGATIVFRCGDVDARAMAPYMRPGFTADDLINLDLYQAAVKMQLRTQTQPAFTLSTLGPLDIVTDDSHENAKSYLREQSIRNNSIMHHTPKSREEVMAWLHERYPHPRGQRPQDPKPEDETGIDSFLDDSLFYE